MKTALARPEFWDKLEQKLNHRRPGRWFSFPSGTISQADNVSVWPLVKFSLVMAFFVSVLIVLTQIMAGMVFGGFFLPQYQSHRFDFKEAKAVTFLLLHIEFRNITTPFLLFVIYSISNFIIWSPMSWAWNRRAERLSREPIPAEPALTAAPNVWPPPPNVFEAD